MPKIHISPGDRYGHYTILKEVNPKVQSSGRKRRQALCRCDCGNEKIVGLDNLRQGYTKSCGCLRAKRNTQLRTTHGMTGTPEHRVWKGIIKRCNNHPRYKGRGIDVCERWRNSFEAFLEDMGHRPSSKHSIDRIDNDGDYTPENCRWATERQQQNNRRGNRLITHNGETMTAAQWSRRIGGTSELVCRRLLRGWTEEEAVSIPKGGRRPITN